PSQSQRVISPGVGSSGRAPVRTVGPACNSVTQYGAGADALRTRSQQNPYATPKSWRGNIPKCHDACIDAPRKATVRLICHMSRPLAGMFDVNPGGLQCVSAPGSYLSTCECSHRS